MSLLLLELLACGIAYSFVTVGNVRILGGRKRFRGGREAMAALTLQI